MELNFVQSSEVFGKNTLAWETEFEATGDFNLHVERNKGGDILVYQRTAGSGYAIVEEFRGMDNKPAIDLDFTSVVYPKFVKIVSESQPTYATVTTDGEITEIKSQSKEIEVTSNGTTEVTPDAGFAYLNSVKVKTNVAGSGEGGEGGNTYEYIDVRRPSDYQGEDYTGEVLTPLVMNCASLAKINMESMQYVVTLGSIIFMGMSAIENITAISVDVNMEVFADTGYRKVGDIIKEVGADSFPRLTKEQFYTL